jgi:hypothetical protein
VDLRESTPQSTATQPSQQQQQEQAGTVQQQEQQQQQQQTEPSTLQKMQEEQPGTVSQQQQQGAHQPSVSGPASSQQAVEGAVAMDADAGAAAGTTGVGSSLVRGVGGGLSQFVKAPMTALKQTAIKLLPTWGTPAGEQQPQEQQQQQYVQQSQGEQQQQQQPDQPFQQPQPEQQQQQPNQAFQEQQQQQQQQQLGTYPCGYPDMSGLAEAGSYDLASMQEYAQVYADQMQQPYDQQAYEQYRQGWGMGSYGDVAYDAAAYSGDWMQQVQMYNSEGYEVAAAAAAAAVPAGPGGSGGGSKGSKASAAAAVKLRQTRCGSCKYCLNRHLKKGCEANKVRLRVGRSCRVNAPDGFRVESRKHTAAAAAAYTRHTHFCGCFRHAV